MTLLVAALVFLFFFSFLIGLFTQLANYWGILHLPTIITDAIAGIAHVASVFDFIFPFATLVAIIGVSFKIFISIYVWRMIRWIASFMRGAQL